MKSRVLAVACFAVLLVLATQSALSRNANTGEPQKAKQEKVIELKATKSTTRGEGADPNIKSDKETNDPNSEMAAPEKKGGAKDARWVSLRSAVRQPLALVRQALRGRQLQGDSQPLRRRCRLHSAG